MEEITRAKPAVNDHRATVGKRHCGRRRDALQREAHPFAGAEDVSRHEVHASTELGLHWAAFIEVRDAYDWIRRRTSRRDRADIVGIEAPVWSETLRNIRRWSFS